MPRPPAKDAPAAAPAGDDQKLGAKDDALFKQVVKLYEQKLYKKAVKTADTILKKNPNHGETMAMKGLTLSCLDENKKEEAYGLVKAGLGKNMKSHVCWHVYGLLYRQDRDYNQAIKCYRNALRHDPDNLAILRDLSVLQIQMRDLTNMTETRQKLLTLKPNNKSHWLGFALAHHLQGNHECAIAILDTYEGAVGMPENRYECSELILYRATVLLEDHKYEQVLELLDRQAERIADLEASKTMQAECHMALGRPEKAEELYLGLLTRSSGCLENVKFLRGLVRARGVEQPELSRLSEEERAKLRPLFAKLRAEHPKAKAIQRTALYALSGGEFREALAEFVRPYLVRTVPALASALKGLYDDKEKIPIVGQVLHEIEESLLSPKKCLPGDSEPAHPLVIVWTWLALSSHYLRIGGAEGLAKANEYIDRAIAHTPTVDTLYMHKAKVLKHEKKLGEAVEMADQARRMDEADRYNNTKATRLLLRADRWEDAEKTINKFAFRTSDEDAFSNIVEMQIQWYELELADCYYRLGDVLSACRRYLLIDKHFADFAEDAFDFHGYCLRKFTMRAYLDMLRHEDRSKGHKFYCYAASRIVRCYLDLHRIGPDEADAKVLPELKRRQAAKPQTKEQREKDKETEMAVDLKQPLEAAVRFLETLQKFRGQDLATQLLGVELHTARGKPLHALQALKRAVALPAAGECKELRAVAEAFFASSGEGWPDVVRALVQEQQGEIMARLPA
eukprot:TRINITY_DN65834_c0_g1_i1.p1 TRINITY_DN65834_c0_g1~~TRINITY_DN65834_c0_g1_i1.p1  ORF type:complete len:776 (+),score=339.97 TRINITY_DN65834_c0_g1_i1:119-2329(+)